jgi:hypothetical protein
MISNDINDKNKTQQPKPSDQLDELYEQEELDEDDLALLNAFREDAAKEEEWLRKVHGNDTTNNNEAAKNTSDGYASDKTSPK